MAIFNSNVYNQIQEGIPTSGVVTITKTAPTASQLWPEISVISYKY